MAINKGTLAKEVNNTIEYIYPKTSADIVNYTKTVDGVETTTNLQTEISALSESIDESKLLAITYANLKALRDNGTLVPGRQYRITDYNTTTVQSDTQSANHVFDIIVTADSTNKLNENARAIQHTTDSTDYFYNSKLNAWILKYTIDNDTTKYAWADSTNGKGVIYYLKDEFNNECGYDFKNIQMKYYKITATTKIALTDFVNEYSGYRIFGESNGSLYPSNCTISTTDTEYRYTFDLFTNNTHKDFSLNTYSSNYINCYNNKINALYGSNNTRNKQYINIISFKNGNIADSCYGNIFGNNNSGYSFKYGCYNNIFGDGCYNNIFNDNCNRNTFGNYCNYNTFRNNCNSNTFGNDCDYNTFGNYCGSNSFGNDCDYNTFGNRCHSNTFENCCYGNTLNSNTTSSGSNINITHELDEIAGSNFVGHITITNNSTFDIIINYNLFVGEYEKTAGNSIQGSRAITAGATIILTCDSNILYDNIEDDYMCWTIEYTYLGNRISIWGDYDG